MSGNVLELCSDWEGKYSEDSQIDPTGPGFGAGRVVRGGVFIASDFYCRVSFRTILQSGSYAPSGGFRLAHP
jgi:formylglycine-generating enzyme required for sulfatase activity